MARPKRLRQEPSRKPHRPAAAPTSRNPVSRVGTGDLVIPSLATLYVLTLLISGAHPTSSLWGVDLLGYLQPGFRTGLTALLTIGLALILWSVFAAGRSRKIGAVPLGRAWAVPSALLLGILFWLLRDRTHLLGDGLTWIEVLRVGSRPLYSEPIAATAMHIVASVARTLGYPDPGTALALLSVGCGLVATGLYCLIVHELIPSGIGRAVALGLLLTLGCNQLYFGYIESYPLASLTILLYLWTLLRCWKGRLTLASAALALGLAVSTHFVASFLIPSFILLVARTKGSWVRSVVAVGLALAVVSAAILFLRYPLSTLLDPVRLITGAGRNGGGMARALPRLAHLLNLCLLVSPIPFLIVLGSLSRRRLSDIVDDPDTTLLLGAAVPGFFTAAVLSFLVFPGHDWDLVTMPLLPVVIFAVKLGAQYLAARPRPMAAGLIGLGAASLLSFALVNADESSAIRRYDALLAPELPLTAHERAYGNERLVKVYTRLRNPEAALQYAQRAVASDPANDRYWGNVGSILYNLKRYSEAATYYEEAAHRGSTRPEVYYYLAQSLIQLGRPDEALQPAQRAIDLGGESLRSLFALGLARAQSGDLAGARRAWDHLLQMWPEDVRTRHAYEYYLGGSAPKP